MKSILSLCFSLVIASHAIAALLPPSGGSGLPAGNGGAALPGKGGGGTSLPPSGSGQFVPSNSDDGKGSDNFADANRLRGLADIKVLTNNRLATKEIGEPNHGNYAGNPGGKSLWWRYQATREGTVTVSTKGTEFDTTLGVYIGDSVSSLTTVAADNDGGPAATSMLTFRVFPNTIYYLAVDGYNGASGNIVMTISFKATPLSEDGFPINDNFANRKKLLGARTFDYGANVTATLEPGDPNAIEFSSVMVGQNVWWQWTAPADGTVKISTAGSSFDTTLFVYCDAVDLYKGTGQLRNLQLITWDDEGAEVAEGNIHASELKFHAYAGETYYIAVDGYMWSFGRATGDIVLNVDLQPHESVSYILADSIFADLVDKYYFYVNTKYFYGQVPPLNDAFAYRKGISGKTHQASGSTANAYWLEAKEPDHGQTGTSFYTTWWTWMAPSQGFVRVSASVDEESSLNPVVALYKGDQLGSLKAVGSDVDVDGDGKVSVLKQVKAGEILQIAVSGDNDSSGEYTFSLKLTPGKIAVKTQPQAEVASEGEKVIFTVTPTVDSLAPIQYQWEIKKNGKWIPLSDNSNFAGVKTANLAVLAVSIGQSGTQYRCVLTNSVGRATSAAAKLTVNPVVLSTSQ